MPARLSPKNRLRIKPCQLIIFDFPLKTADCKNHFWLKSMPPDSN